MKNKLKFKKIELHLNMKNKNKRTRRDPIYNNQSLRKYLFFR